MRIRFISTNCRENSALPEPEMMDVERTTMVAVAVGPGDKSAAYRDLGSSSDPNMYYAQEIRRHSWAAAPAIAVRCYDVETYMSYSTSRKSICVV